jgi:hypothetical protein
MIKARIFLVDKLSFNVFFTCCFSQPKSKVMEETHVTSDQESMIQKADEVPVTSGHTSKILEKTDGLPLELPLKEETEHVISEGQTDKNEKECVAKTDEKPGLEGELFLNNLCLGYQRFLDLQFINIVCLMPIR